MQQGFASYPSSERPSGGDFLSLLGNSVHYSQARAMTNYNKASLKRQSGISVKGKYFLFSMSIIGHKSDVFQA